MTAPTLLPVTPDTVVRYPEVCLAIVAEAAVIALHHALHGYVGYAFLLHGKCVQIVAVLASFSHPGMERSVKEHISEVVKKDSVIRSPVLFSGQRP